MGNIKYRYAYKNEKVVCIDDVSTHEVFHCISCGREMVAKLGEKRTKHFAHKVNEDSCDPNKYLHELAKSILLRKFNIGSFKIKLNRIHRCIEPSCPFNDDCKISIPQEHDLKEHYHICEPEKNIGNYRADLLISGDKKESILIEIFVTHECTPPKINSGLKIIEIPIKTEDDIEYFRIHSISEEKGVRFYGFKRESSQKKEIYNKTLFRFILHKSGAAFVDNVSCQEQHKKKNQWSIFELNISNKKQNDVTNDVNNEIEYNNYEESEEGFNEFDDDYREHYHLHSTLEMGAPPLEIGLVYAINQGIEIRNCHLCKYMKDDNLSGMLCCLYKKYGTPRNPNQKDAASCQYYRLDENKKRDISDIIQ